MSHAQEVTSALPGDDSPDDSSSLSAPPISRLTSPARRRIQDAIRFDLRDNCVTRENVRRGLSYWLEDDTIAAELSFQVSTPPSRSDAGWSASFELFREGERIASREFEGADSCEELSQALVLTMAIAIDGSVLDRTARGRPELQVGDAHDKLPAADRDMAGSAPPASEESSEGHDSRTAQKDKPKLRQQWDVSGAAGVFVFPEPTALVGLRGGLVGRRGQSVHLGVGHGLRREFPAAPARASAELFWGQLQLCGGTSSRRGFQGSACLGTLGGLVQLRGVASEDDRRTNGWLVALGPEVSGGYAGKSFFVHAFGAGALHLVRPRLLVETPTEVRATSWPWGSMSGGLRVGVFFPPERL